MADTVTKAARIGMAASLPLLAAPVAAASDGAGDSSSFETEIEVSQPVGADAANVNPTLALNDGDPITPGDEADGEVKLKIWGLGYIQVSYSGERTDAPDAAGADDVALELPEAYTVCVPLFDYKTSEDTILAEAGEDAASGPYEWHVTVTASYDW